MSPLIRLKKFVGIFFSFVRKVLPASLAAILFNLTLRTYKAIVRLAYKAKKTSFFLMGNEEGKLMVKKIDEILPYTLVGISGLEITYKLAKIMNQKKIKGSFVELGVARGGCAALLAGVAFDSKSSIDRNMWLFDSFEGLPEPTQNDYRGEKNSKTGYHVTPLPKGACLGTLTEIQSLFSKTFNFPTHKVFFVKGWFNETLPIRAKDPGDIAILRIDGDWYESTKCCLEFLYDQVVPHGAVIIDDYENCFGCKKATDEFINDHNLKVNLIMDGRGGCYFIKPHENLI